MEFMLQNHVFPLFRSELGYMRARVCNHLQTTTKFHVVQWLALSPHSKKVLGSSGGVFGISLIGPTKLPIGENVCGMVVGPAMNWQLVQGVPVFAQRYLDRFPALVIELVCILVIFWIATFLCLISHIGLLGTALLL